MRGEDPARDTLPVAGDEERPLQMHGGRSLAGAESPRFRHGWYTREAIAERRAISALIANSRETIYRLEGET